MSNVPTRSHPHAVLGAATLLFLLGGCGGTPQPFAVVSASVPCTGVNSLHITAQVAGTTISDDFPGCPASFGFTLPPGAAGSLSLTVSAMSDGPCTAATGQAQATIVQNGRTDLSVALAPFPAPLCTLTVQKAGPGSGTITSDVGGVSCPAGQAQPCTADVARGTTLKLTATPEARSYLAGWTGTCATDPCVLTVNGPTQVSALFAARSCTADNWCWEDPLPEGTSFNAMWGSGPHDAWIGGQDLLHWDGQVLSRVSRPAAPADSIRALWGAPLMAGQAAATDVWAAGDNGLILHWDGQVWTSVTGGTSANLAALSGTSVGDVWAVGAGGTVLHFDGTAWSPQGAATTGNLTAVWASSPTDVWAVGGDNMGQALILHGSGKAWTVQSTSASVGMLGRLAGLWGSGTNDVWASGSSGMAHFDGKSWTAQQISQGTPFGAVWGTGTANVWTTGGSGSLFHFDGQTWTSQGAADLNILGISGLWGSGPNDVWAVGGFGVLLHFDGAAWTARAGGIYHHLLASWGSGPADVWAVGYEFPDTHGATLHWDGRTWTEVRSNTPNTLNAISGSATGDVWTAGNSGTLLHWNGAAWQGAASPTQNNLFGVWSSAPGNLWVVGDGGVILQGKSLSISAVQSGTTASLRAVWGSGPGDVWAVGLQGTVLHYDGMSWSQMSISVPGLGALTSVWGSGPHDVWVAGGSLALHWDGAMWTAVPLPSANVSALSVWVSGPGDVWMAGNSSTILHFSQNQWTSQASGVSTFVHGLWGTDSANLWGMTDGGIVRYRP